MPLQANTQYAQRTDLANLGLIGGVLNAIPNATQDAALVAASAVIDSYLQNRFPVPLTNWGQDIVRATCIIASYDLLTSKGYSPATGADPNIKARVDSTIEWLANETPAYLVDGSGSPDGGSPDISSSDIRGWTPRGDDVDVQQ